MNERFPHTVIISRLTGGSAFTEPTSQVIYNGKCRNYRTSATNIKDDVMVGGYTLSLPLVSTEFRTGDDLTVNDNVRTMKGVVKDCQYTNFGVNVWWDLIRN